MTQPVECRGRGAASGCGQIVVAESSALDSDVVEPAIRLGQQRSSAELREDASSVKQPVARRSLAKLSCAAPQAQQSLAVLQNDTEVAPSVARIGIEASCLLQFALCLREDRSDSNKAVLVPGRWCVGAFQEALDEIGLTGGLTNPRHVGQRLRPIARGAIPGHPLEFLDELDSRREITLRLLGESGDREDVGENLKVADVAAVG